ncbi:MAG: DUF1579 family protein [Pirellulaceae bacterium]
MSAAWGPISRVRNRPGLNPLALGKLWTLGEMSVDSSEGSSHIRSSRWVLIRCAGSSSERLFPSCMTYLWFYEGSLDEAGRVLTLDAEGPSFLGEGAMGQYQDIIEFVDADTYLFSSRIKQADGTWLSFMSGNVHPQGLMTSLLQTNWRLRS